MNKQQAQRIAESGITTGQVHDMLIRALIDGAVDNGPSIARPQYTKLEAYRMYITVEEYNTNTVISDASLIITAIHALRDFGEYWREKNEQ